MTKKRIVIMDMHRAIDEIIVCTVLFFGCFFVSRV